MFYIGFLSSKLLKINQQHQTTTRFVSYFLVKSRISQTPVSTLNEDLSISFHNHRLNRGNSKPSFLFNRVNYISTLNASDSLNELNKKLNSIEFASQKDLFDDGVLFYQNYFDSYLKKESVKPMIAYFESKGLLDADIKDIFKDHMAVRMPNKESGFAFIKDLIERGLYEYKSCLLTNGESPKFGVQTINMAGGSQIAVTLSASKEAIKAQMPTYFFVSMRQNLYKESNLYLGLEKSFNMDVLPTLKSDSYFGPAYVLTDKEGAGAANHLTIDINKLIQMKLCKDIDSFKEDVLKHTRYQENYALAIKDCPDVKQYAFKTINDEGVYVELLERYKFGSLADTYVEGFSTDKRNIERIGEAAS